MILVAIAFIVTLLMGFPLAFVLGDMGRAHLFINRKPNIL